MPAVLDALAEYRVHPLGSAALADPDVPADGLLSLRNTIVDVDLEERALVAERAGDILGFACWGWHDPAAAAARTVLIVVRGRARGAGVGTALQRARMQSMRSAGARTVHTWSDDPAAVAWYERHFGYRRIGEEPVRHALHRFRLGERSWWAVHRGFPGHAKLAHLVADLPAAGDAPHV
jgi:ribosomal protein S18 acetylase RimI-like enzyme